MAGAASTVEIAQALPPFLRSRRRLLPWLLGAVYAALLAAAVSRHEMWRDEIQAWLIARDSSSFRDLVHAMRYEGHPPLWHLLLWPIAHVTWNPAWMQVLHVAIASASALLLLRFSPFSWLQKILLLAGYFFAFEWAVIARNYAPVVCCVFAACSLWPSRWQRPVLLSVPLVLMSLSHAEGLLIALAMLAVLALELVWPRRGATPGDDTVAETAGAARAGAGRIVAAAAIAAAGIATSIVLMRPDHDAGFAHPAYLAWTNESAPLLAHAVISGYLPVPRDDLHFWNTNALWPKLREGQTPPAYAMPAAHAAIASAVLLLATLVLATRPWTLVMFAAGTASQLAFFHAIYFGSVRHHGFLFLVFVTALWMSFHERRLTSGNARVEAALQWWDRRRTAVVAGLLVVHVYAAWMALSTDWNAPFSQAKATAEWIDSYFPDRAPFVFVGDYSPAASAVLGYLQQDRMYYPDREEFGSYVLFDTRRQIHDRPKLETQVKDLIQSQQRDAVLVLSHGLGPRQGFLSPPRALVHLGNAVESDEQYSVYWIHRRP
ncbi:MAG TPA: hypothetical protein VGK20_14220 [Candidatus Binatia bacterium]